MVGSGDFGARFKGVLGDIKTLGQKGIKSGYQIGLDLKQTTTAAVSSVKKHVDEAIENAAAEPVGKLKQSNRPIAVKDSKRSWYEDFVLTFGKILNAKSLHIAMFFMLLDWMVSQSYLTAIYPIIVFCYILIQNPLQLPLIQTGKNGIVYEQDRLTEEIYDALTRWAVRHLELKKAEEVFNQENREQGNSEIRKSVYSTEISKPATLSTSSSTSSTKNKHWKCRSTYLLCFSKKKVKHK